MNDAILKTITIIAVSPSLKNNEIHISRIAQIPLINIDLEIVTLVFIQSWIVEDARAFIDELSVDMAAERTPANNNPLKPTGKWSTINEANSLSLGIFTPPKYDQIREPAPRNTVNCKNTHNPS